MKVSFIWLNGYCYCHNSCSKCPPFARTHARRRPRHSSVAFSMTLRHSKRAADAASVQFINVVNPRLTGSLLDDASYLVVNQNEVGTVR